MNIIKGFVTFSILIVAIASTVSLKSFDFNVLPNYWKQLLAVIMFSFVLFAWFYNLFKSKQDQVYYNTAFYPIIGILFISSISFFWSTDKYTALEYLSGYFFYAIVAFTVFNLISNIKDYKKIVDIFLYSITYVVLIGLIQFYDYELVPIYDITYAGGSTFGNKNFAGHFVMILFPFLLYRFFSCNRKFELFYLSILLLATATFIVFIDAMQMYVSILVMIFLALLFFIVSYFMPGKEPIPIKAIKRNSLRALFVFLSFFIAFLIASNSNTKIQQQLNRNLIVNSWGEYVPKDYASSTASELKNIVTDTSNASGGRINLWLNTLNMFKDKPLFGFGVGQWFHDYDKYSDSVVIDSLWHYKERADHPHNDYIKILVEQGIVGVIANVILFFYLFKVFFRNLFLNNNSNKYFFLFVGLSFANFLVFSIFSRVGAVFSGPFLAAVVLGLAFSIDRLNFSKDKMVKSMPNYYLAPVIFLQVMILVFVSQSFLQDFKYRNILIKSDPKSYVNKVHNYKPFFDNETPLIMTSITAILIKEYDIAESLLKRALKNQPKNTEIYRQLANVYTLTGQPVKSVRMMENILELDPEAYITLRSITDLMSILKKPEHEKHYYSILKKTLDKYIPMQEHHYSIEWEKIVKIAIRMNDFNYALSLYNQYLNFRPEKRTPERLVILGVMIYNVQKDKIASKKVLDSALRKDPNIKKNIPKDIYSAVYEANKTQ